MIKLTVLTTLPDLLMIVTVSMTILRVWVLLEFNSKTSFEE